MTLRERISRLRARRSRAAAKSPKKAPRASRERPKTGAASSSRTAASDARRASDRVATVILELGKLARDMLVIPAQLYLAAAEIAGNVVLVVWRRVLWPLLGLVWALLAAAYGLALRHVTPARAVFAVALAAAISLGASQWLDYRGISIGTDAYAGELGIVAPPPEIGRVEAGEAHSWVMVPLAVAALVTLGLAVTGRPRLARILILVGAAAIAIAVLVDVPNGLDEGTAAVAYEGAMAHLLEGFWLQIAAAATLIAAGLLLPRFLRAVPASTLRPAASAPLQRFGRRAAEIGRGWAAEGPRLPRRLRDAGKRKPRREGRAERKARSEGGIEGARP